MKIGRFLGFTDDVKEPRKTKMENEFKKCYRYNGVIYNTVEFLCVKLLEGCYPEKEDGVWHYKRNGEKSKPKTIYKYMAADGRTYFPLNKTQYDFVCYLIKQSFNSEEAILWYDKEDVERIEELERKEAEETTRKEEEERAEQEARERVISMVYEKVQELPENEKELINNIFLEKNGIPANTHCYALAGLIHDFDNKYCKEELMKRLKNNDNKASMKVFEQMTGLTLPKGMKARISYLQDITSEAFKLQA